MERSAAGDDLVTCPECRSRDHLVIRWIPEIDHRVRERTEVGCARCDIWRAEKEDKWAFAQWNHWACLQWRQLGTPPPHSELYALLLAEMECEKAERLAAAAVQEYLNREVAARCKWAVGDRFVAADWPRGTWSVRRLEAVYGTNTGPFCILHCCDVLRSGILGDSTREFWDTARLRRLRPFWKPSTWAQVVAGDSCQVARRSGVVLQTDAIRRRAEIQTEEQVLVVTRLSELLVPVSRVET
jgi:hypothetical protein